jgi:hypothetical protein
MKFTSRIKETADDVSQASKQVLSTSQVASVALIAVTTVAVLALVVSFIALSESKKYWAGDLK